MLYALCLSAVCVPVDACYSAKRINLEAEKKVSSTFLDYIPHRQILNKVCEDWIIITAACMEKFAKISVITRHTLVM
jgi:hypothetical protein